MKYAAPIAALMLLGSLGQSIAHAETDDRFVALAPGHDEALEADHATQHPLLAPYCGGYPFGGHHVHCGTATGGPSGGLF